MKTRAADRPPSSTFHAVTHVWGREYLDLFLNVCLPNQLAPGNVPALPAGSRYRILTRSIHTAELSAHPMVERLRQIIPVDVVVTDALDGHTGAGSGHRLMTACHQRAIADILAHGAAIIMLSADVVLSDRALAAVVARHRAGYRAVLCAGLRLAKEPFLEHLQRSGPPLAALSSRQLVRLALPHLHAHTRSMFVDAARFSATPVAAYWRVGDDGLLARCFHLHPLMVDPVRPARIRDAQTADGAYVWEACPDRSRVHVVTDSDELVVFELTGAKKKIARACDSVQAPVWRAAVTASKCDALQLDHWRRRPICFHAVDRDGAWTAAAGEAQRFANAAWRRRRFARRALRWIRRVDEWRTLGPRRTLRRLMAG